ncbi:hypothetical protein V1264_002511 [Littorina saxatilis]|uniref:Integrase catalytic domain-containing protein n=1 Tax=Littorina saxatilis TaxID=31220 RepID=A0AAN9B2X5_9CAEN
MPHDLPSRQWETFDVDLFEFEGRNYLVTVDYFSNFLEIDRLENTTSTTIIKKLKSHFARCGSPCVLISDNGPQFTLLAVAHLVSSSVTTAHSSPCSLWLTLCPHQ